MRHWLPILIIILCLCVPICFADEHTVKKIYSGNRIKTQSGVKIQYIGLEVPGEGRFFYEECKKANIRSVNNKTITIEYDVKKKEDGNIVLGYVYAGDVFVNAQLLKNGFAMAYIQPPNQKYASLFIALQNEARKQRRGIWAFEDRSDEPYYVGSKGSRKFHRPGCRIAREMEFDKRIIFRTKDEALQKGFTQDWRCNPLFKKREEKEPWSNQKK